MWLDGMLGQPIANIEPLDSATTASVRRLETAAGRFVLRPGLWERAREVAGSAPPKLAQGVIHRDVHHDNVLGQGRDLVGVIDWLAILRWRPNAAPGCSSEA